MCRRAPVWILCGIVPATAQVAFAEGPLAAGAASPFAFSTGPRATSDVPGAAPVDVAIPERQPERRVVALEWNPVALLIDRLSANVEIVPFEHHALILSPFYFDSRTAAFPTSGGGVLVPSQRFEGVGGEIGYRYYAGDGGPRGFFVGPSFLAVRVDVTPSNGLRSSLMDYGVALDVGWQAMVADRWVVSLGVGGEYVSTSRSIPDQQAPASYYADSGLHPRALAALGYAF